MKRIIYAYSFFMEARKADRESRRVITGLIESFADGWDGDQVIRKNGIQIGYEHYLIRLSETETTVYVHGMDYRYD